MKHIEKLLYLKNQSWSINWSQMIVHWWMMIKITFMIDQWSTMIKWWLMFDMICDSNTTKLTAKRWQRETESPMVRGADPLRSVRLLSQHENTVRTRMKVTMNSTPNPCSLVSSGLSLVKPRSPRTAAGVSPFNISAPAIAPTDWAMMYRTARTMLIRLANSMPMVHSWVDVTPTDVGDTPDHRRYRQAEA